ncbi:MFS transporter [Agrobacterium rhizogenes]|uniref:MFS transporter n=1 Tax=Rhizobium rhizogenes TaxID=359 RepID=UPI001375E77E|nr:MFS transporter [Rhizobium rhizogenes]NTF52734.1 MFS transporter [Rhizobium rhizogenes]NTF59330.1 MFS transporter [Rhizobium rhizogenes]NTF78915.1 MFS transporter [Rhizobium rhizogenes]NTG18250.1 MFS transporter [Rhizobium rhizogenes]NTG25083.1 MFS transporter [Rhizobium rhizogenes]
MSNSTVNSVLKIPISRTSSLLTYSAYTFLSSYSIGGALVLVAWLAVEFGSIAAVGQLFLTASITDIFFSVLGGTLADRFNRKTLIFQGLITRAIGFFIVLVGTTMDADLMMLLFAYTILNSLGMALISGAIDGVAQSLIEPKRRVVMALRLSILRQCGIAIGTGSVGFILSYFGSATTIYIILLICLLQILMVPLFSHYLSLHNMPDRESYIKMWADGLYYIINTPNLISTVLTFGFVYSVGQITNMLIPGFVKGLLQSGSDVYGSLEMSWAIGGGCIVMGVTLIPRLLNKPMLEYYLLSALGVLMIVFSLTRSISTLIIFYAFMGGMFSLIRSICEGNILLYSETTYVGRVRAVSSILKSLIGIVVFSIPSVFTSTDVTLLYSIWGFMIFILGTYLALRRK